VNELLKEWNGPAVLAGDLNDIRGSQALQILERDWRIANDGELPTIPVERPARQIDFVLVRPRERWRLVESRVLPEAVASDHRAILSVLELVR
jgi:endonuclease/exonuclease/phosphatase (EEP) superfamily protein YafD